MGIRLHNSTWHRPLRTLNNWPSVAEVSPSTWHQRYHRCTQWLGYMWESVGSSLAIRRTTEGIGSAPVHRPGDAIASRCTPQKLRVTRKYEGAASGPRGTRLVISGRMADVCAELDRLAALEAHRLPQSG